MGYGHDALLILDQVKPSFHPSPAAVGGPLENQFKAGPREVPGAAGASYAIGSPALQYIADLPASEWTSIESGCGYSTVVLASAFKTHISVNPDLSSNRLVREFIQKHIGRTGLRHVEESSDQGLPDLVAEGIQVDVALIDGNHSYPFPLLDFHYMDQMLVLAGRLLVDNIEIEAVQELTDYLDVEPAYKLERVVGNCGVYRKVQDRAFGWKSQVIRKSSPDLLVARRELAQLRMDLTPELRVALSGAGSIPSGSSTSAADGDGASGSATVSPSRSSEQTPLPQDQSDQPPNENDLPRHTLTTSEDVKPSPPETRPSERRLSRVLRWYFTPSGVLLATSLVLLAVGFVASGPWRLVGVVGVAVQVIFVPYRSLREQRRTDERISAVSRRNELRHGDIRRALGGLRKELKGQISQVESAARSTRSEFDRQIASAMSATNEVAMSAIQKEEGSRIELGHQVASIALQVGSVDAHVTSVVQARVNDLEHELGDFKDELSDLFESVLGFGGGAQPFTRIMKYPDVKALLEYWSERLELDITPKHIQYLARKFLAIEANGAGRIATSVGDAMIRALVARSVKRTEIQILEIGTLFGLGALFVGEAVRPFVDRVELTLLDPLDGYYGGLQTDPPTGLTVTRAVLDSNIDRLAWPREDVRVLQGYSTDDEVLSQASDREYDVMILDGDHSYDGVRQDFERYAHLVRMEGLLVVDDYGTSDWPDVSRYADDVIRSDIRFDFVGSGSRTAVFRRGGRADPPTTT